MTKVQQCKNHTYFCISLITCFRCLSHLFLTYIYILISVHFETYSLVCRVSCVLLSVGCFIPVLSPLSTLHSGHPESPDRSAGQCPHGTPRPQGLAGVPASDLHPELGWATPPGSAAVLTLFKNSQLFLLCFHIFRCLVAFSLFSHQTLDAVQISRLLSGSFQMIGV